MKSGWMIFALLGALFHSQTASALDVVFLTQSSTQPPTPTTSRLLRAWSDEDLKKIAGPRGEISAQKLIIDESTQNLDLTHLADVDLITLYAGEKKARVPRFMIWRGFLKLEWDKNRKFLISYAVPNRLLVPIENFKLENISKIELAEHSVVYPGTSLVLKTNPAASRGEKLFTQSCLACHSLNHPLTPTELTPAILNSFSAQHLPFPSLKLDAKAIRGLVAYSEALAFEKNKVKPSP